MAITRLQQLKACQNRKELAVLLGYKPKTLAYVLYQRTPAQNYKTFKIKKKNGGNRVIDAPNDELLFLQRRASDLLQDCLQDAVATEGHKSPLHHGFQRKKSIVTNAKPHRAQRFVFNIDLSDFFSTINFGRVYGFFKKNRNFQLVDEVAATLAQICCYQGRLPQGAPTSPVASNLICQTIDYRLSKLAERYGCSYTRYADDLTFSTSERKFPRQIGSKAIFSAQWSPGRKLNNEIKASGFLVNASKTRMQYAQSRQTVTGLVVNKKINVTAEFARDTRAMVHSYVTKGSFYIRRVETDANGEKKIVKDVGTAAQILGRLSHIRNVKTAEFSKSHPQPTKLAGYEETYSRLLLFDLFHFSQTPTLIMEGKTDIIYIKAALRKLQKDYPLLIKKNKKSFDYKFKVFNFSETNKRILGIDGGSSHLAKFLSNYRKESRKFCKIQNQRPVICVIDNDSGAKPFLGWKDSSGNPITRVGSPFHLFDNVYLILTPNPLGKTESKIEDYFTKATLGTKISGKSFNPENIGVTEKEYGKAWFSTKVVWTKKSTIKFDHFKPLLDLINSTALKVNNPKP